MKRVLLPLLLALVAAPAFGQDDDNWGDDWGDEDEAVVDPAEDPPAVSPSDPVDTAERATKPEASSRDDAVVAVVDEDPDAPRLGDPLPLTRREPTVGAKGLEVSIRYGLVGSGPTRFINDLRYGITDWLELRTSFQPFPSSLMARVQIGRQQSRLGAFLLEGGLAHLDVGLRIVPDLGEQEVGIRAHLETSAAHAIALGDVFSLYSSAHYRYRMSGLTNDEMHAISADTQLTYDLLPYLSLSAGVGFAAAMFDTGVKEIVVNFVETDRPGMNHFLLRDDGENFSVTLPLAMTYGRTESFDVDIFCTPRLGPKLDVVFGAGVRWRTSFAGG
jgi:hypothetical protein